MHGNLNVYPRRALQLQFILFQFEKRTGPKTRMAAKTTRNGQEPEKCNKERQRQERWLLPLLLLPLSSLFPHPFNACACHDLI